MPIFGGIEPPNIEQTTPLNQDVLSAITLDKGVKSGQRYLGIDNYTSSRLIHPMPQ
jgi:hypothetical protein